MRANKAFATVIDHAEVCGYTLPADVVDTYAAYRRLADLDLTPPTATTPSELADQLLAEAVAGGVVDLQRCASTLAADSAAQQQHNRVREVLNIAVERAHGNAVGAAADLAEVVISDHLRPAFETTLAEVRKVAKILGARDLSTPGLLRAPAGVRTAYLSLPGLSERLGGLWTARRALCRLAGSSPQWDDTDRFLSFRKPQTFHPSWRRETRAPLPSVPWPEDLTARLLFWGSDAARDAEPWFPTVPEQDAAWFEVYGDSVREQQASAWHAQASKAALG